MQTNLYLLHPIFSCHVNVSPCYHVYNSHSLPLSYYAVPVHVPTVSPPACGLSAGNSSWVGAASGPRSTRNQQPAPVATGRRRGIKRVYSSQTCCQAILHASHHKWGRVDEKLKGCLQMGCKICGTQLSAAISLANHGQPFDSS